MIMIKNKVVCILLFFLLFVIADVSSAEEKITFGVGGGFIYNGFGINFGKLDKSDFKYMSLGCIGIGYSTISGIVSNCGIGIGWVRSDILTEKNNKHGLGGHLGVTYNTSANRHETEALLGISYAYFFKGMNKGGWNLGLGPTIVKNNKDTKGGFMLQAGYQF